MTRTLILTRHTKSSWQSPAQSDHDRPLNKRGERAARALGDWMRKNGWSPDQVLSSDATRTRQTYAGLGLGAKADFIRDLYHTDPNGMRGILARATGETVLMLGHNPVIAAFAAELARDPPRHPLFYDYPTGATSVLRFDVENWADVAWRTGEVVDFVVPRDLPET